jgi:pSer/pThr/pTyr-binding forkhead associated (FHA) protein
MEPRITLTVTEGKLAGKEFVLGGRMVCTIGRAGNCCVQLPSDTAHQTVSRHHCLLEIDAPRMRVRDCGSLNGTYVNGEPIGRRTEEQPPEGFASLEFPERELHEGDKLQVGNTIFCVHLSSPTTEEDAPNWETEDLLSEESDASGVHHCAGCMHHVGCP